jgi:hypothetical protein
MAPDKIAVAGFVLCPVKKKAVSHTVRNMSAIAERAIEYLVVDKVFLVQKRCVCHCASLTKGLGSVYPKSITTR